SSAKWDAAVRGGGPEGTRRVAPSNLSGRANPSSWFENHEAAAHVGSGCDSNSRQTNEPSSTTWPSAAKWDAAVRGGGPEGTRRVAPSNLSGCAKIQGTNTQS
ncbi:MAG: hypothetical protein ABSC32_21450, partial [Steroidobacteraceae bacterium]